MHISITVNITKSTLLITHIVFPNFCSYLLKPIFDHTYLIGHMLLHAAYMISIVISLLVNLTFISSLDSPSMISITSLCSINRSIISSKDMPHWWTIPKLEVDGKSWTGSQCPSPPSSSLKSLRRNPLVLPLLNFLPQLLFSSFHLLMDNLVFQLIKQ